MHWELLSLLAASYWIPSMATESSVSSVVRLGDTAFYVGPIAKVSSSFYRLLGRLANRL